MPIFEYVCDDCQKPFERLVQKDEKVECPCCHGDHLSKQYSTFGMSNGSGKSLPIYNGGGGGCGCTPSSCGCKN
jgi:putative FmdB family regulatory protein